MAPDPAAQTLVARLFEDIYANRDASFGNGRDVLKIFYKTLENQSQRIEALAAIGEIESTVLDTIIAEDIPELRTCSD